ncbi:uncharacterized protein DSM5745_10991 [Aspergillus mulundensis]|uniref:Lysosomal dipeptide transporter MFSD1 n=1 Tax=Aspergillus mulundensis TaxID=1810919 RepID=A0A3D8QBS5_9EURO|nr:hypothetical protein DSM5745_10991 [Aspergillus mulundensis]RDW59296.1 hypothetical protein DSM5745_10991 [Aspergillus mulundensis]
MIHWRVLAAVGAMNWGGYFSMTPPGPLRTHTNTQCPSLRHPGIAFDPFIKASIALGPPVRLPDLTALHRLRRSQYRSSLPLRTGGATVRGKNSACSHHVQHNTRTIAIRTCCPDQIRVWDGLITLVSRSAPGNANSFRADHRDKSLSLALALNLGAGRLGSVANSIIIPRVVEPYGVAPATWIATALSLGVAIAGALYLLTITKPEVDGARNEDDDCTNSAPLSFRQFSPVYWQLALICLLSYGCLNTFTNSAQRFLAVRYYHGDQRSAGSAMSIVFILSGILVPVFGFLLDSLSSKNYPLVLITSNILLMLVHAIFITGAGTNPILPLCLLGNADALFSVCFWASVVRCLLPPRTDLHAYTPPLKAEDSPSEHEYEPILSRPATDAPDSEEDGGGLGAETLGIPSSDASRTLGLGIMSSLLNTSTAVVPIPLAVMENLAGLAGLETVFLTLAFAGFLAAVRLAWI